MSRTQEGLSFHTPAGGGTRSGTVYNAGRETANFSSSGNPVNLNSTSMRAMSVVNDAINVPAQLLQRKFWCFFKTDVRKCGVQFVKFMVKIEAKSP